MAGPRPVVVVLAAALAVVGAVLVPSVGASGTGAGGAAVAATGGGTVTLVPGVDPPVPYGPVVWTASGTGCPPDQPAVVQVGLRVPATDTVSYAPLQTAYPVADATGAWTVTASFPTAYPGTWSAWSTCGPGYATVEVTDPDHHELTATPGSVTVGVPAVVTVRGSGCRSPEVVWRIGGIPGADAGGVAPVGADGTWTAEGTLDLPAARAGSPLPVVAACRFADGAQVLVDAFATVDVVAAPVPSTTTGAPPPATPAPVAVASPAFTG